MPFQSSLQVGSWGFMREQKKGRGGSAPFGYFFGKVHHELPKQSELSQLKPEESVLQCKFGDLGLIEGKWHIIGIIRPWIREDWPMPALMIPADKDNFLYFDQLIQYDENFPSKELYRERHPPGSLNLPLAAMPGSTALEWDLSDIISGMKPAFNCLTGGLPKNWRVPKVSQ